MTKRDFKTRRNFFKGRMKTAHDFESFRTNYERHKIRGKTCKLVGALLVAGVFLLLLYFTLNF
jgi:hypothetical protein